MRSLRQQNDSRSTRPFPIFLATHSNTIVGKKDIKNFPFEITPISISAIADCKSPETPCGSARKYLRPLHWNNSPEKGFVVDLIEGNRVNTWVKKYFLRKRVNDIYLSHAMSASGGLVAKVFSLHLHIRSEGKKIPGVRKKYVLSDGGKADNVGLIPLVERGSDLIILSQIASDANLEFGDLQRSAGQVKRLFGINIDTENLILPHKAKKSPFITFTCFSNREENGSSLWLIKPTTKNVMEFYEYLKSSGKYSELLNYLQEEQMAADKLERFPQNDTIKLKYPPQLMYAYFALGEYIGEMKLSYAINNWLNSGSQCTK